MTNRDRHENQVDPFNAGEPSLPWDEPHAFEDFIETEHTSETCTLDDGQYTSPTKRRDAYQAPQTKERALRQHAERAASADKQRTGRPMRPARAGNAASSDPAAAKSTRRRGKHRVLKTIVLLLLGMSLVRSVVSCTAINVLLGPNDFPRSNDADTSDTSPSLHDDDFGPVDPPSVDFAEAEITPETQACIDAVNTRLGELSADNEATRALLVEGLTAEIEFYFDCTPEKMGLDVNTAAASMLERSSFSVDAEMSTTLSDGSGWVYINATCPTVYEVGTALNSTLSDYLIDHDLYGSADELDEEQKAEANKMLMDAVEAAETEEDSRSVDLLLTDGSWVIDEADWTDTIRSLYGIYL